MTAMDPPPGAPRVVAPPTTVPPPPAGEPVRSSARRWPWVVGAVAIAAIVGLGVWWLLSTTVSESAYDEVTADLAAAEGDVARFEQQVTMLEQEVASLEADNEQLTAEGTALQADITRLTGEADAVRQGAALALLVAEAQAHDSLNTGADLPARLEAGGGDFSDADALLAALGHEGTFKEWAADEDSFFATDRAMAAVDDERLWAAWNRWYEAEPGSPQEQAAYFEYLWRLNRLVVETLGATQE